MMESFITKDGKRLRRGYTTGSCAAAAAKSAALMLLTGRSLDSVHLITPFGIELELPFWGPHMRVSPAGGAQSKSETFPSAVNTTLNGSPAATTLGASMVRFWAYSAAVTNNSNSVRYFFILRLFLGTYQFFSF